MEAIVALLLILMFTSPFWIPVLVIVKYRHRLRAWVGRRQIDAEIDYYENQRQNYIDGYERRKRR
ncbi:hypothetical protein [Rhodococcus sp. IEGM 1374]|uniref:hypothetical protein n=1 Tax=Rhodococcus sp. IEGM 1374 TaxID=3082221 RepID=UPI0029548257|nr:hypothetical protein [Rhodococcus sp. IEGM 1374]MDV7990498.1 hypothetical protein [Rhodococcus sp. IEGM 1374]